jgi:hypothetical protein
MKYLKKFNESESTKYEMELKDYFYDFTDNGFVVDIKGNVVTGKCNKSIDPIEYAEIYVDTLIKLKHYFGIVKTLFSNSLTSTSFFIEVKNKIDDDTSIEVFTRSSNTKIKVAVISYSIYNNQLYLRCKDINNKIYSIKWNFLYNNARKFKIGVLNGCIDLENSTKVCNNIINNVYKETDRSSSTISIARRVAFINTFLEPTKLLTI